MPGVLRRSRACFPPILLLRLDGIAVSLPAAQYDRCRDKQHCQYAERIETTAEWRKKSAAARRATGATTRITRAVGLADWLRYCWR